MKVPIQSCGGFMVWKSNGVINVSVDIDEAKVTDILISTLHDDASDLAYNAGFWLFDANTGFFTLIVVTPGIYNCPSEGDHVTISSHVLTACTVQYGLPSPKKVDMFALNHLASSVPVFSRN